MALGGGCEVLLHCDAIVAHAETYSGLVEAGVGLIPSWGGCKELLARFSRPGTVGLMPGGPMPPVNRAFEMVGLARVSQSAAEARELGILRRGDVIVMNRDRVLGEAIDRVHALAADYVPPEPPVFPFARALRKGCAGARRRGSRARRQGDAARRGGRRCPRPGADRRGTRT